MFVPPRYIYLEFSAPGKNDSSITFFVGNLGKPDGIIVAGIETARREIGENSRADNNATKAPVLLKTTFSPTWYLYTTNNAIKKNCFAIQGFV